MLLTFEVIVYTLAKSTGSLSVNDADTGKMSDVGVIEIFVELCDCLVHGFSEKVDFRGNACGFGHLDFSLSGAG